MICPRCACPTYRFVEKKRKEVKDYKSSANSWGARTSNKMVCPKCGFTEG